MIDHALTIQVAQRKPKRPQNAPYRAASKAMQERTMIATFGNAQRRRMVVMAGAACHPLFARATRVRQEPQDAFDRSHASKPFSVAYAISESKSSTICNESVSRTTLLFTFVTSLLVWSLCPVSATKGAVVDSTAADFTTEGAVIFTTRRSDSWSAASQVSGGVNQKRFTPPGPLEISTLSKLTASKSLIARCTARTSFTPESLAIFAMLGWQLPRSWSARDAKAV